MIVCVCFFIIFKKLHSWVFLNNFFFASAILHEFVASSQCQAVIMNMEYDNRGFSKICTSQCFFGEASVLHFLDLKIMILKHTMDFCEKNGTN